MVGRIKLKDFREGDEKDVSELVHFCLDSIVSKHYDKNVMEFLRHLYTPERIASYVRLNQDNQSGILLASVDNELSWVSSYEIDDSNIEIRMFYGLPRIKGIIGAGAIMEDLEEKLFRYDKKHLTGNVLIPARPFFENFGKRRGKISFSEPTLVEDIDPETKEKVLIDILRYSYTPRSHSVRKRKYLSKSDIYPIAT